MVLLYTKNGEGEKELILDTASEHSRTNGVPFDVEYNDEHVSAYREVPRERLLQLFAPKNGRHTISIRELARATETLAVPEKVSDGVMPVAAEELSIEPKENSEADVNDQDVEKLLTGFADLYREYEQTRRNRTDDPIRLYVEEAASTPLLTRAEELELAQTIERERLRWRQEMLSSPLIQKRIVEEYLQVCEGTKPVTRFSKFARAANQAKAELRNREDIILADMKAQEQQLRELIVAQEEYIDALVVRVLNAQDTTYVRESLEGINEKICMILERNPSKDAKLEQDSKLEQELPQKTLERQLQRLNDGDIDEAEFVRITGETAECVERRLERAEEPYRIWKEKKQHMAKANLRLVISIAKNLPSVGYSFLDRIQDGNIGLMKSIDMFEWQRGNKFCTLATWWIGQNIRRERQNNSQVMRIPPHTFPKQREIKNFIERYNHEHDGKNPTDTEIADATGESVEMVRKLRAAIRIKSLNMPSRQNPDKEFGSVIEDKNTQNHTLSPLSSDRLELVRRALENMAPRERDILSKRYGITYVETVDSNGNTTVEIDTMSASYGHDLTLEETASYFLNVETDKPITRERARQIEVRALKKLLLGAPELMDYGMDRNEEVNNVHEDARTSRKLRLPLKKIMPNNSTSRILLNANIQTVEQLLYLSDDDLCGLKGFKFHSHLVTVHALFEALDLMELRKSIHAEKTNTMPEAGNPKSAIKKTCEKASDDTCGQKQKTSARESGSPYLCIRLPRDITSALRDEVRYHKTTFKKMVIAKLSRTDVDISKLLQEVETNIQHSQISEKIIEGIPNGMKEDLLAEANTWGISMNAICILKLATPLQTQHDEGEYQ